MADFTTKLAALLAEYAPAWEIHSLPSATAWIAERRSGDTYSSHTLVAYDLDELGKKLEKATREP
jgi:hypothetical protein